jgi:outer membrane protein TolC
MGLPPGQELTLTDTVPFAELVQRPHSDALALAYERRKDLLTLQAQLEVATRTQKAVRYQRLPTLAFGGFYGVQGETTGLYHGVFSAQGSLSVPVFREGEFRGEAEVASAQVSGLRRQIESLRVSIDEQIRASELDVQSADEMVKVARSNVALAQQEFADASDRFVAGVADNLPVVQAEARLAGAQSQLVSTMYQFNTAKLQLARNTGVVETQYKQYLGR